MIKRFAYAIVKLLLTKELAALMLWKKIKKLRNAGWYLKILLWL